MKPFYCCIFNISLLFWSLLLFNLSINNKLNAEQNHWLLLRKVPENNHNNRLFAHTINYLIKCPGTSFICSITCLPLFTIHTHLTFLFIHYHHHHHFHPVVNYMNYFNEKSSAQECCLGNYYRRRGFFTPPRYSSRCLSHRSLLL